MQKDNRIKVIIAAHKEYPMPADPMYLPLHVGAEGKTNEKGEALDFGYEKDNSGDNISCLNASFCELTGLYWAWKNLDADYIGLAHYRRHFSGKKKSRDPFENILTGKEAEHYFSQYKVLLPKKRCYYIETLYTHYKHTHYIEHMDTTRDIIAEKYPEYTECFDKVMKQTSGYMFNMMIMPKELMDDYCSWLFSILFELKERMYMPELSAFQGRFYGRVSEIIFNVWLQYQFETGRLKPEEIKELPCIYMEKIDWKRKIVSFLKAKFLHQKYDSSF